MSEAIVDPRERARRQTYDRNKWFFSLGGIGRDMSYVLISSFLLVYIQFGAALTLAQFTTLSLFIGVGGRVWDAINDPMMGAIIEGSHFKWGKFKPWILIGAVSCALVIVAMFNVQSLSGWTFVVFMCLMYLLWEATFTMNDIGYWAMLPSLSSKRKERNMLTTLTVTFAGIGALIVHLSVSPATVGDLRAGYRWYSVMVAAAFIGCQLMTSLFVKEPPRRRAEKQEKISVRRLLKTIFANDQVLWMTLSMLFYNIGSNLFITLAANLLYSELSYNGGLYMLVAAPYAVVSVLINVLYPWLSRFGRRRLQAVSITVACVGYAAIFGMGWFEWFPFNSAILAGLASLVSGGQSLFYMATIVNMTNCVEYNDYKTGERNEAIISTLRPFMAKFASALEMLIITIVLAVSGVFLLSQSISTLETQRDMFARLDAAGQASYITSVQTLSEKLQGAEPGGESYDALLAEVDAAIDADPVLSSCQLSGAYLPAVADAVVMSGGVELGRLGTTDADALPGACELAVADTESGEESAANLHFKDKITLGMRVWLRVAAVLIPIAMLVVALVIQRKKFFIDEAYYDKMLAELEARNPAPAEEE